MFKTIVLLSLVLISTFTYSQNLQWAKRAGSTAFDMALSTTIDSTGAVYTTGYFQGTVDFDPGIGTFNLTSSGIKDIFILKLDKNGQFIWAKKIGGTGDEQGNSITVDNNQNILLTGSFATVGPVDFDPGPITNNLTIQGSADIFILKLNAAGNFIWVKGIGGNYNEFGNSITTDASNNVIITGKYQDQIDWDPGAGSWIQGDSYSQSLVYGTFLLKLNSLGVFSWVEMLRVQGSNGSVGSYNGLAVTTDGADNILVTGTYTSNVSTSSFGYPFPSTTLLSNSGGTDIYVAKFSPNNTPIWLKGLKGINDDFPTGIAVDASNQVYVTGYFSGTIDLDPGTAQLYQTSNGSNDIFITKLASTTGNLVWSKSIGGAGNDRALAIDVDVNSNVYATGSFVDIMDFDPNVGVYNLYPLNNLANIFILKLNSLGNFQNAYNFSGSTSSDAGVGYGIRVENTDVIHFCGQLNGTIDFDPSLAQYNLTSSGGSDIFSAKISSCPLPAGSINGSSIVCVGSSNNYTISPVSGATSYVWSVPAGATINSGQNTNSINVTFNTVLTGNVIVTPTNSACNGTQSSISVTVNATPTLSVNNATICAGNSVNLTATGATTYSWSTGATTSTITVIPTVTSNYSVIGISNGCSNTTTATVTVNSLPTTPTVTASGATTFCQGGSVVLTSSIGTGLTYQWKKNGTNITGATASTYTATTAGTYVVVVTNPNNCSATSASTIVTVNALPAIPTLNASGSTTFCQGSSVVLTSSTATGLTYQWQNNSTNIIGATASTYTATTTGTYVVVVTNANNCSSTSAATSITVNSLPTTPIITCYETATFNSTTCQWDVTGTQPTQPTTACYETATFNSTTCQWNVTGTQPTQPTTACYETATFNSTTCQWDVTGTQPTQPTTACYETATFNSTTCQWGVTGTQPSQPTTACYETATFNSTTCQWDVTGTQATISQPLNQTININNNAQFVSGSSDPSATFQWQTDLGTGFQNLNSVGQYSGTTNDTLNVANVTMSNNNQPFRCVINSGSCSDNSNVAVLTVNNNVGINEFTQANLISVYPNPANSQINVKADANLLGSIYTVYDNNGKVVLSGKINTENTVIELGNLSGGVYLFSVGENLKQTFKVIKE